MAAERATTSLSAALCVKRGMRLVSDNENPSGVFFTLFLRSFILLHELECVVGASVVGGGAKSDQRCARGFAVLQYTRKHGLVRERSVCVTSRT